MDPHPDWTLVAFRREIEPVAHTPHTPGQPL
jgi:hypothetical protein